MRVRGAREHNLKNVDVDIPRDALVVFTGVSGSGKSSLAFGTLYAEAQRRYFESVAPYARRLIDQMGVPESMRSKASARRRACSSNVAADARSSVGSVTTLSNLLRMLYSRAGAIRRISRCWTRKTSRRTRPGRVSRMSRARPVYEVTERRWCRTIRSPSASGHRSLAARMAGAEPARHPRDARLRRRRPWRDLPKKDRDWILFTDEQPTVPVYAGFTPERRRRRSSGRGTELQGTFTGARRYVLHTFATRRARS